MAELNTPIVVVAYNRPKSLLRLLNSLAGADYPNKKIDLIISIDKSDDNEDVLAIAKNFKWDFGNKIINYQETNLGLKAHILKCGDFSNTYGAVIVLEDDLFVSPNFYNYTRAALQFSRDKEYIGGISLYNHLLNVHTMDNFAAIEDIYDNWYFQFASSWGQAWSKDQWKGFSHWLNKNPDINNNIKIPLNVRSWSEKSWLKYNIAYLIEKDQYFLYPKISLTTNFSDAGTHVGTDSTSFQVPLLQATKINYNFGCLEDSKCVYDAFYENTTLNEILDLKKQELSIDLYGYKPIGENRFLLTSKKLNYKIIKSYGRYLKPLETNILYDIPGNDFMLYDLTTEHVNIFKEDRLKRFSYNVKFVSYNDIIRLFIRMSLAKGMRFINRIKGSIR